MRRTEQNAHGQKSHEGQPAASSRQKFDLLAEGQIDRALEFNEGLEHQAKLPEKTPPERPSVPS
ncbi:hypothetical protein [Mesorhizobium sp.]|uniref:hypothetical protein n=1 Tax=Mesorhizobium sp. TaxID=1871066 RepID=UPI0025EDBAFB|nr:hypothetical protein [Mesorhizobium sp.]